MAEKRLKDLDLHALIAGRAFHHSPSAWEDQVLYFLMLDRFSDGNEKDYRGDNNRTVRTGRTPLFRPSDNGNAITTPQDASQWNAAGATWVGGTLKGLESKLGYLQRLGVTAIWVSPIFKQVSFQNTYHGYGPQDFLDVDPHFGIRDDLKAMVATAHRLGLYVILDILLNHTGNVFAYDPDRYWTEDPQTHAWYLDPRWDAQPYRVTGYRDHTGAPSLPFGPVDLTRQPAAWPNGALWPAEFQASRTFTQEGRISNWDYYPEFVEGDFGDLKDIHLGTAPRDAAGQEKVDEYQPSAALNALCEVYKFWIAFADLDGFRVDTVKHMDLGAMRYFTAVMHEFAETLGKENFYLIGEITGGRQRAFKTLEETGMDAALGIDDIPDKMEYLVKGYRNPQDYFTLFRNSLLIQKDSHIWFKNKVVTVFDDHDQIRKGNNKARFCAGESGEKVVLNVLALNALTLGIPCIYYGSEQAFDGRGGDDRYIREAMFGGAFGAFRSRDRHFFNEATSVYQELKKILALRAQRIALRRGRQYLRQISGDGVHFGFPEMVGSEIHSVIPWSRIFDNREMLVALNTDYDHPRTAWVIVDHDLHQKGDVLTCLYSTDATQITQQLIVQRLGGETIAVNLTVPPAGLVIYE